MDFGYDLLVNPQKIKSNSNSIKPDISFGNDQSIIVDMIEDDIVESMPYIHSKIDNHILREIINISIRKYEKMKSLEKLKKQEFNTMPILPNKKIFQPRIEESKKINFTPRSNNFDLTKLQ